MLRPVLEYHRRSHKIDIFPTFETHKQYYICQNICNNSRHRNNHQRWQFVNMTAITLHNTWNSCVRYFPINSEGIPFYKLFFLCAIYISLVQYSCNCTAIFHSTICCFEVCSKEHFVHFLLRYVTVQMNVS